MSITTVIHWLGGLVACIALALLMMGIWQGTRRAPGLTAGPAPGWLRSPLFYAFALAAFLAFSVWAWRPLPFELPGSYERIALVAGCLLYFSGIALVIWGRLTLGSMYFVSTGMGAQLFAGHRLVTNGPFGLVRHPMYTGLVAAALGSLLIYHNWTCLAFFLFSPFVLLRARREEQVLAGKFGAEWLEYCRRIPAFLPKWRK